MEHREQKEPMDAMRFMADRMDDSKAMSVKDVKTLVYSICGYAECLITLNELMKVEKDTKLIYNETQ